MSVGIKVSKSGVDVKKAKPDETIIDSSFVSPKVFKSGVATFTGELKISHNLGYRPFFRVFFNKEGSGTPKWRNDEALTLTIPGSTFFVYSNEFNIEIHSVLMTQIHYFIFYEEGL